LLLPKFFLIADIIERGADGLFHGHASRKYDFRSGVKLGEKEHLVKWKKPSRPKWLNEEIYNSYPSEISMREFKVNRKIYVTTLLDHKKYNKKELVKLYALRWQIEINLRSIKTVLNMEHLSCKTPDMIKKEIAAHMLGYNIIRIIIAEACNKHSTTPNQTSFKGTVQLLNQFMPKFSGVKTSKNSGMYSKLLSLIILNKIGNRPGRVEPRMIKRRQKPFQLLKRSRKIEQNKILKKYKRSECSEYAYA
jgi:hypothetical protein